MSFLRETGLGWLTLFATSSTLICCAIPIALVSLGFGTALAALTSSIPVLMTLSEYKTAMFSVSAILFVVALWVVRRPVECPTDRVLASACRTAKRWNMRLLGLAGGVWAIGFATSYLALPFALWLDG